MKNISVANDLCNQYQKLKNQCYPIEEMIKGLEKYPNHTYLSIYDGWTSGGKQLIANDLACWSEFRRKILEELREQLNQLHWEMDNIDKKISIKE